MRLFDELAALAAFLWPGPCAGCGGDLPPRAAAGVCSACWADLPLRTGPGCPRCDLPSAVPLDPDRCPDCRGAGLPRRTVAAFVYDGALVRLHRRLKFAGAVELVPPLAARMAAAWRLRGAGDPPEVPVTVEHARMAATWRLRGARAVDIAVPVPPDPLRFSPRRRVPWLLARGVAADLDLPCAAALAKVRPTRPLTGGRAQERRGRLARAFRARPAAVAGRRVLVVDDVATTGATLREAARALIAAGAADVAALVLARTPLKRPASGGQER